MKHIDKEEFYFSFNVSISFIISLFYSIKRRYFINIFPTNSNKIINYFCIIYNVFFFLHLEKNIVIDVYFFNLVIFFFLHLLNSFIFNQSCSVISFGMKCFYLYYINDFSNCNNKIYFSFVSLNNNNNFLIYFKYNLY